MKKEIPPALIVGSAVLLLVIIMTYGYTILNPKPELRTGGPRGVQQRPAGAQAGARPAMPSRPDTSDVTQ